MIIQIVVEHSVKCGREQEVLGIVRDLRRKGHTGQADALLGKLLLIESNGDQQANNLIVDKDKAPIDTWPFLLNGPAKIKLHLSG